MNLYFMVGLGYVIYGNKNYWYDLRVVIYYQ